MYQVECMCTVCGAGVSTVEALEPCGSQEPQVHCVRQARGAHLGIDVREPKDFCLENRSAHAAWNWKVSSCMVVFQVVFERHLTLTLEGPDE